MIKMIEIQIGAISKRIDDAQRNNGASGMARHIAWNELASNRYLLRTLKEFAEGKTEQDED